MALCLLAFAALAFLAFGPRIFLAKWLNRDLGEEGYFQSVSSQSLDLGLFLNRLTVKGLKFARSTSEPDSLEFAEIRVSGLSAVKILKASLGLSDWLTPFADAPVEVRGATYQAGLEPKTSGSLKTLSLKFFRQAAPDGPDDYGLAYLKLTDLSLKVPAASPWIQESLAPQSDLTPQNPAEDLGQSQPAGGPPLTSLSLEALAVNGLSLTFVESVTLSGLSLESLKGRLAISSLAATAVRPWDLGVIDGQSLAGLIQAFAAVGELEVLGLAASLGPKEPGQEGQGLALAKGQWSNLADDKATRLTLTDFAFDRPDLALSAAKAKGHLNDPAALALWEAVGPKAAGEFSLSLPKGQGSKEATASLSLKGQGELKLSFWGPGEFFASLAKGRVNALSLATGFGPGEILYADQGLAKAWLAAYAAQVRSELGPDRVLNDALSDFVAATQGRLADPLALAGEIQAFFAEPGDLALKWSPPPGYPLSSIQKMTKDRGLAGPLGLTTAEAAANDYAPLVLNDLNLTLTVNDRFPKPILALTPGAEGSLKAK
jgi:hypothetical protein